MDRIELLAKRVTWLDRRRRRIAVIAAIVVGALLMWWLPSGLGVDWPTFHARLMSIVLAIFAWAAIEVALAWLAASWATEVERTTRADVALPRASIRRSGDLAIRWSGRWFRRK